MTNPTRHNPIGGLSQDDEEELMSAPQASKPKLPKVEAERIARQAGFFPDAPKELAPRPRRAVTGRNVQLNLKATQQTIDRLKQFADELGVPMAEVLERALDALAKSAS